MIGELDGLNRLVFYGPFLFPLLDGKGTHVPIGNLVIASKNGGVAKLSVSRIRALGDTVLGLAYEVIEEQKTLSGMRKFFEQNGACMLGKDLFWLKPETEIYPPIIRKKEEKPKTIQELRATARKTTFEGFD